MKVTKLASLTAIAIALALSSGCKHRPVGVTQIPNSPPGRVPGPGNGDIFDANGMANGTGVTGENMGNPLPDPSQLANYIHNADQFHDQTVHFAYDSSVVRSDDKAKIATVADYLKSNPSNAVEVDGHCDERGTDEYNRALGERRALAVRDELISMGVDANKVLTVSYGRERPVDTGHSEAAHAKNRRAEFILLTPP